MNDGKYPKLPHEHNVGASGSMGYDCLASFPTWTSELLDGGAATVHEMIAWQAFLHGRRSYWMEVLPLSTRLVVAMLVHLALALERHPLPAMLLL